MGDDSCSLYECVVFLIMVVVDQGLFTSVWDVFWSVTMTWFFVCSGGSGCASFSSLAGAMFG